MEEYEIPENQLKIIIPISDIQEQQQYRKAIIGILSKIEIDPLNEALKEDLKVIYRLLNHLSKYPTSAHDNAIHEYKSVYEII